MYTYTAIIAHWQFLTADVRSVSLMILLYFSTHMFVVEWLVFNK